jgi:hypothetical protein
MHFMDDTHRSNEATTVAVGHEVSTISAGIARRVRLERFSDQIASRAGLNPWTPADKNQKWHPE